MATKYQVTAPTLYEAFDTIGDWTIITGTGQVTSGGLELTSASGSNCVATKTINTDMTQTGVMRFDIYIADIAALAKLDSVEIFLASVSNLASYHTKKVLAGKLHEGHNYLLIGKDQWTASGGEVWTDPKIRLRVRVNGLASQQAVLRWDSMYINGYDRPKICVIFDDSRVTQYTKAYAYMKKYRMIGTIGVNSEFVDFFEGYMTTAELKEVYDAGWQLCNHTSNHPHMDLIDIDTCRTAIQDCEDYLIGKNFTRDNGHKFFIYPYGGHTVDVAALVQDMGFVIARGTSGSRTQSHEIDEGFLFPWTNFIPTDSLATAEAAVDRVISDGGVMFLTFHAIEDSPTQNIEWATADFQSLIDYIYSKRSQVDTITWKDWYYGLTKARKDTSFPIIS